MLDFYKGKKVFITGHTGFKGSWLCKLLANAGADVTGYSLNPPTSPSLFEIANIESDVKSVIGDIRDFDSLKKAFDEAQPEIVLHLAAQPIVRDSYKMPAYTYETNVMGTVNILECVRQSSCVKSFLNVTTDKVYENRKWQWGYRENEPLDGFDPYSNRNPHTTRPYQHVLEPLYAYLMIAKAQYGDIKFADCYNVGPDECDCITTGELVDLFVKYAGNINRIDKSEKDAVHEANFLKLDCSKLKTVFGWKPHWHVDDAVKKTVEWLCCYTENGNVRDCMDRQIEEFLK